MKATRDGFRLKYQLHDGEMADAVALLRKGPTTASEVSALMDMRYERARHLLSTVGVLVSAEPGMFGRPRHVYGLAADYEERMEARRALQGHRQLRVIRRPVPPRLGFADMYPTGDPTHFDTDGLGRVVYRGPVARSMGPKWALPEDAAHEVQDSY
jgi:hypothetical protein